MSSNDGLVQGKFVLGSNTHVGDPRRKHEDRVYVGEIFREGADPFIVGIVADGVGSADSGARAAELTIDKVVHGIRNSHGDNIIEILEHAIKDANQAVYEISNASYFDGLSTLVVAAIYRDRCFIANVGNGRAYWVSSGSEEKLSKLTRDHSYYNIYGGDPDDESAEVLVNAIGRKPDVYIDCGFYLNSDADDTDKALQLGVSGLPLKIGDSILLCSDGLINTNPSGKRYISDEEIITTLRNENKTDLAATKMVNLALGRRPDDNISAVTIQYGEKKKTQSSVMPVSFASTSIIFICMVAAILWSTASLIQRFNGFLNPASTFTPTPTVSVTPSIVPTNTLLKLTSNPGFTRTPFSFDTQQPGLTPQSGLTITHTHTPVVTTSTHTPKPRTPTPSIKMTETEMPTAMPNPTQTLQAAFEEIDRQFDNLAIGNLAFNKPEKMDVNDVEIIELILSPSLSQSALATQLVDQGEFVTSTADPNMLISPSGGNITVETSQIEITPRMKAVLIPQNSEAFIVEEMHDDAEQVISTVETTTWRWSVAAKKQGSQTLELVIYQLVKYDGKEFWHEVETYKADIVVEVTPKEWFKSWWAAIIGAITTIAAVVISVQTIWKWFEDRKKKTSPIEVKIMDKIEEAELETPKKQVKGVKEKKSPPKRNK